MIQDKIHDIVGKLPSGVKLVAVSKFHSVPELMEAYRAGQRCFGENRPQEFAMKVPEMPSDIEWHFIGHLQTNKLKLVLPYASLVESIDSKRLLDSVNAWGKANGKVVPVLLELHLGAEETKGGFTDQEIIDILSEYVDADSAYSHVRIRGLMGMATNTDDEAVIDSDFSRIEAFKKNLDRMFPSLDGFTELSIGMSDDWQLALRHGATIIRVGTAIFGPRKV
ncbi:MAG: YggS family pyridoxal phosphate-dependent enzyme [Bacteroidales bacterium]|uniref:YggS family pyridoxal phosphate-dependent enzyme n=1 Tax=Candidatus Cryptobacteroides sp. TaxID=2952915 RepID=UPI002A6EC760|nr:YggS family pyridoxal phosphate-dependent enzyme [Candidatus Cryptobacteroides sp.]MDD6828364.1 YggS family pyridoxal phosphate-dependent enzyme [Bacteroidales bacterium]MDD7234985.1 YggS family pyridoxal phosphate-dependent enzyme [Bacteroidales bacterium]MDD7623536.1 YggS family pyridoxal phosphate-dependent enzyme [Bacteroidales bacterium]MDY2701408.1 YggS family pyridoxal phosphate-dependent enzyme [Candidatus Cryptobacteroides sp.]MDY3878588.1 YggS family pyridoxal phosphate-dependent 